MLKNDSDWELLETQLDGALSVEEEQELSLRLGREPELADALRKLRQERGLREQLFASLEPDRAEADAWASGVCALARMAARQQRSPVWGERGSRWLAAVAACLLIGFLGGWLGRGRLFNGSAGQNVARSGQGAGCYQASLTDDTGRVIAVQNFDSLEKAQDFARDVHRWQEQIEQLHNGAVPIAEAKF